MNKPQNTIIICVLFLLFISVGCKNKNRNISSTENLSISKDSIIFDLDSFINEYKIKYTKIKFSNSNEYILRHKTDTETNVRELTEQETVYGITIKKFSMAAPEEDSILFKDKKFSVKDVIFPKSPVKNYSFLDQNIWHFKFRDKDFIIITAEYIGGNVGSYNYGVFELHNNNIQHYNFSSYRALPKMFGDFNNDGILDVILVDYPKNEPMCERIQFFSFFAGKLKAISKDTCAGYWCTDSSNPIWVK